VHEPQDVDQRITRDVERLAGDMAALVPTMVKPVVDILWFSTRLWALTGRRGMAVLYIYAALGFGCLRCAAPHTPPQLVTLLFCRLAERAVATIQPCCTLAQHIGHAYR